MGTSDRAMRHREANDVSDAGREERVDPCACDASGVQRKRADACVGIGDHKDIAPRTACAHGLRQVTADRKCERDAIDRGKGVPERRDGIEDGFHALTLSMRCTTAQDPSLRCWLHDLDRRADGCGKAGAPLIAVRPPKLRPKRRH
jgi:hypothetical protein